MGHSVVRMCAVCGTQIKKAAKRFCGIKCYNESGFRSQALVGKPKPWQRGSRNPNWQNKAQSAPGARERLLARSKERGLAWTADDRARHAATMRGPANKMRGRTHTEATKLHISAVKKKQYADGIVKIARNKLSKPERAIAQWLAATGQEFSTQFHIKGVPYLYDFYFPRLNLLVEFNGDYWHANPRKHHAGTMLRIVGAGFVPIEAIWARDEAKKQAAEAMGFRVATVWEMDFRLSGMECVLSLMRAHGHQDLRRVGS